MSKRPYRTGSITKEQAIKRFNEYYNKRSKTPIARLRAKMFDMMYQKKPKFTLRPGEPGSEKYLLEEGPRTFDMVGVDYFDEGEKIIVEKEGPYAGHIAVSKGATFKKPIDNVENVNLDLSGRETSPEIYGPRIKSTGSLYNKHFRDVYNSRKKLPSTDNASLKEQNIVDKYWELYRNDTTGKYKRKNKQKNENVTSYTFMSYSSDTLCTIYSNDLNNVEVLSNIEPLERDDFLYLKKLNILVENGEKLELNNSIIKYNLFKLTIDLDPFNEDEDPEELILDTLTGKLYYLEDCEFTNFVLLNYLEAMTAGGNLENIIDAVPTQMCKKTISSSSSNKEKTPTITMVKSPDSISKYNSPIDISESSSRNQQDLSEYNRSRDSLSSESPIDMEEDSARENLSNKIIDSARSDIETKEKSSLEDSQNLQTNSDTSVSDIKDSQSLQTNSDTSVSDIKDLVPESTSIDEISVSTNEMEDSGSDDQTINLVESKEIKDSGIDDQIIDMDNLDELTDSGSDDEVSVIKIKFSSDYSLGNTEIKKDEIYYYDDETNILYNLNGEELGNLPSDANYIMIDDDEETNINDQDLADIDDILNLGEAPRESLSVSSSNSANKDELRELLETDGLDPSLVEELDI